MEQLSTKHLLLLQLSLILEISVYYALYGITAQLCLRPSPNLLPHPCSYKRGGGNTYSIPALL